MENNLNMIINGLVSVISLIGICVVSFWFLRDLRVDACRQKVFDLRNEVFMYAARGNIAFDHPAYTMLRHTLNGAIRFSHRLSLLHIVTLAILTMKYNPQFVEINWEKRWEAAIMDLPEENRADLQLFQDRLKDEAIFFLFFGSFTKKVLFLPIGIILITLGKLLKKNENTESCASVADEITPKTALSSEISIHDSMDTWAHRTSIQSLRIKPVEESVDSLIAGAYVVGAAI